MEVDVRMYIRTMDQMAFGLWSLCCRLRRKKTEQLARNLPITHLSSLSLSLYMYIYIYAVYIYLSLSIYLSISVCVCVFSQQFGIWAQYNPNITLISVEEVVISQINQNDLAVTSL